MNKKYKIIAVWCAPRPFILAQHNAILKRAKRIYKLLYQQRLQRI